MAMSKKNYHAMARCVACVDDWDTRMQLVVDMGREFEKDNVHFDFWLWKAAVQHERDELVKQWGE